MIYYYMQNNKVGKFSLEEDMYKRAIIDFPSDRVLGEIPTAKIARESAVSIWLESFGSKINNEKPYKVFFDDDENVWLVTGTLPRGWIGGVAYILIQKSDGKVLAVWHDQ